MHGLSIDTYNKLKMVLDKYPECEFKLFGSRAKGTYKYNSDIDIAIINNVENDVIDKVKLEVAMLDIIYKVDIVVVKNCKNDTLIENIKSEGVDF